MEVAYYVSTNVDSSSSHTRAQTGRFAQIVVRKNDEMMIGLNKFAIENGEHQEYLLSSISKTKVPSSWTERKRTKEAKRSNNAGVENRVSHWRGNILKKSTNKSVGTRLFARIKSLIIKKWKKKESNLTSDSTRDNPSAISSSTKRKQVTSSHINKRCDSRLPVDLVKEAAYNQLEDSSTEIELPSEEMQFDDDITRELPQPKMLHAESHLEEGQKTTGLPPPGENLSLAPRGADLLPCSKVSRSSSITSGTDSSSSTDDDDLTDIYIDEPTPFRIVSQYRLEEAYKKSEQEKTTAFVKIKELEEKLNQRAKEDINHVPNRDYNYFDTNTSHIRNSNDDNEKSARDPPQLLKKDYTYYFDGNKSYICTDDDNKISARSVVQWLRSVQSKNNESIAEVCSESARKNPRRLSLSSTRARSPTPPRPRRKSVGSSPSSRVSNRRGRRHDHRSSI